jgi:hypothetical protein
VTIEVEGAVKQRSVLDALGAPLPHAAWSHLRAQHATLSISGNPQAIILKRDCNAEHTTQDLASDGIPPILYSMACHRGADSLVIGRAAPCSRAVD